MVTINWPAVAVAMVLGVFIQALWYSKPLFGPAWQRLSNLDDAALTEGFLPRISLAFLGSLASAWCLAGFFNFTGSNDFLQGSLAGLELFLGLVAPAMATEHVFGRRSAQLLAINLAPAGLALVLQGGLLAAWK
jgi:hypothetical protein